jgi:hypothetical protein
VGELLKKFAADIYEWFQGAHWAIKSAGIIVLCAITFFGGRCGTLGSETKDVLWGLVPWETALDCARPTLYATLSFSVLESGSFAHGRLGATYPPKSVIKLTAKANRTCWMTLFSVDSNGRTPIFPSVEQFDVAKFDPNGGPLEREFLIDDTRGSEVYLLVASNRSFLFSEVENANESEDWGLGRGPDFSSRLKLPPHFAYDQIYFVNLGGGG